VIVQVVSGLDQVGPLHYFYASDVIDDGDFNESHKESVPIRGGTAAVVDRGSSLSRLLGMVDDARGATFAEVVGNDAYGRHTLARTELGQGAFGGLDPAFYTTDPGTPVRFSYVRPQRNDDDPNGSPGPDLGLFTTDERGSLLLRVHLTGELLDVGVTATPTDASSRSFTFGSDPTGAGYRFDWHLPGGGTSTEATPTYVAAENALSGTYPVDVALDDPSDGSFGWGSTTIQLGAAPSQLPSPTVSPGTGGHGPADNGPTHHPSTSASAEPNPDPDAGGGQPTGAPTLPPVPDSSTGVTSAPSVPGPTPTEPTEPTAAPDALGDGDEVTGVLLTAAEGATAGGGGAISDSATPSPAARQLGDPPIRVSTAVWWLLGALLLLLVGAESESSWLRRRLGDRWSKMAP
jgi:hypothetical protein